MITIYKVEKDTKNIIEYETIDGGLAVIEFWMKMEEKYLPCIENHSRLSIGLLGNKKLKVQEIWNLVDDKQLTIEERMIMASTFDFMIIKKEYIPFMIEVYCSQYANKAMKDISSVLKNLYKDNNCFGYGIIWSSVSDYYIPDYNSNNETIYPNINKIIEGCGRKCTLLFTDGHFDEILDEYKQKSDIKNKEDYCECYEK